MQSIEMDERLVSDESFFVVLSLVFAAFILRGSAYPS